jgi:hypothetical protein
MIRCVSNKKVYLTEDIAEQALIEAHTQFEYTRGSGPVAVYPCDDCGYYHLTSQGPMNKTLERLLMDGKIQRQKEANQWMNKLKKR